MRETARKILGNELAEVVHDIWGFDEGETRRRSGHARFWFFGRNLEDTSFGYRSWTYGSLIDKSLL